MPRFYGQGLAVVALVFIAATALTWRKWSNLTGDLSNELYIPWRLSRGAVLYRDEFYYAGGPFSKYLTALIFKIFGASFLALALSNLTLVAIMLATVFRCFARAADSWTAATICSGIVLVFAFGYYYYPGFNYVTPYCNEALYGLIFSIFAVACLSGWALESRLSSAAMAGFCTGVVFLTKPDIFIALACAVTAFAVVYFPAAPRGKAAKSFGAFVLGAAIPPLFFFFYFLRIESWHDSLRYVVFGFLPVFNSGVVGDPYYRWCTGLDTPALHVRTMVLSFTLLAGIAAYYAAVFRTVTRRKANWERIQQLIVPVVVPAYLVLVLADYWRLAGKPFSSPFLVTLVSVWLTITIAMVLLSVFVSRSNSKLYRRPWALLLILVAPLLTAAIDMDWLGCGGCLPLLSALTCVLIFWNRRTLGAGQRFVFPLLWSVFGLVLLSKLGLFPRIWHYGFVLAMPAFAGGVYCVLWLLPKLLEKKWQVPAVLFRGTAWIVLIIGFLSLFHDSEESYARQTIPVGSGSDLMFASHEPEHAEDFNAALAWIEENVPKDGTLAVLPQGAIINFLTRRINPTPCVFWDSNELPFIGEATMTQAFERSPPDYVVIVHRDAPLIDLKPFGAPGYGGNVIEWIQQNYRPQRLIGHEPLAGGLFGIKILKRITPASSPGSAAPPISQADTNGVGVPRR